jgi:hypothetical protein
MDFGTLVHAMALGTGLDEFAMSPKFDRRTKEGKLNAEAFDKENEGKIIINEEAWNTAKLCASSVLSSTPARKLIHSANIEKEIERELFGVQCKSKIDGYGEDFVFDLKTTNDIYSFKDEIKTYEYDTQLAFYDLMLGGKKDHFLIVVCKKEPFETIVFNVSSMIEVGIEKVKSVISFASSIVQGELIENNNDVVTL